MLLFSLEYEFGYWELLFSSKFLKILKHENDKKNIHNVKKNDIILKNVNFLIELKLSLI